MCAHVNCFLCIPLRSGTPQQGASLPFSSPSPHGSFNPPVSLAAPVSLEPHPSSSLPRPYWWSSCPQVGMLQECFSLPPKNIRYSCHSLLKPFHISIVYRVRPELFSPGCAGFLPRLGSVFLGHAESAIPVCSSLSSSHTKALGLPPHPPPFH